MAKARKRDARSRAAKPQVRSRQRPRVPRATQQVGDRFARTFAPPELYDPERRREWRLEEGPGRRGPYILELNLQHADGLAGALATLESLRERFLPRAPALETISRTYFRGRFSPREWQRLLREDGRQATALAAGGDAMRFRAVYKLWPDFPIQSQIYRSLPTIKANAAQRAFEAEGRGIVWAVVDSGIDGSHPHFATYSTLEAPEVASLHRAFVAGQALDGETPPDPDAGGIGPDERARRIEAHRRSALSDPFGHGTHVAGIIAGAAPSESPDGVCPLERVERPGPGSSSGRGTTVVGSFREAARFHGVAPRCRLVSLKVLDAEGQGRSSDVIRALAYVREQLNDNPKLMRVHGVNLSVGYEFDAEMFACGQSPLCAEVNRLVQSGVVVVTAAGNTGYGTVAATVRASRVGLANTINDPGNAEDAITVGATHRDAPYLYGVSFFSSKGPTGDGRAKPDLVAPGERITSCGAGARLRAALASADPATLPPSGTRCAYYVEDSGTSMAAPHVSGAIAAFLSIRREFIGRPLEVKRIFTTTASPLGRERYFEGHGLVDLVRAIQSV
jgi:subtilisin family serine protease